MTTNWQCQICGLCMVKKFVSEHKWLTGHKKIIQKDVNVVASEIIGSLERLPKPFVSLSWNSQQTIVTKGTPT